MHMLSGLFRKRRAAAGTFVSCFMTSPRGREAGRVDVHVEAGLPEDTCVRGQVRRLLPNFAARQGTAGGYSGLLVAARQEERRVALTLAGFASPCGGRTRPRERASMFSCWCDKVSVGFEVIIAVGRTCREGRLNESGVGWLE
jgi:hypothetical protein